MSSQPEKTWPAGVYPILVPDQVPSHKPAVPSKQSDLDTLMRPRLPSFSPPLSLSFLLFTRLRLFKCHNLYENKLH